MNKPNVFIIYGEQKNLNEVSQEMESQIKGITEELIKSREELAMRRIRVNNGIRKAFKSCQDCRADSEMLAQEHLALLESDIETANAAREYVPLLDKVQHLTMQLQHVTAIQEKAQEILGKQGNTDGSNDEAS